jgi:hypothetical protein
VISNAGAMSAVKTPRTDGRVDKSADSIVPLRSLRSAVTEEFLERRRRARGDE